MVLPPRPRFDLNLALGLLALLGTLCLGGARPGAQEPAGGQRPVFRSAVDVVDLDVTVSNAEGRFVRGLKKEDFELLEDGLLRPITHFSAERVPISLGIVVDTSESMAGAPMRAARAAVARLLADLPDPRDEAFIYRFGTEPELLQGWTTHRDAVRRALDHVGTGGGTALFDATAAAVRLAATGQHRKRAVVVISDGNDTASRTGVTALGRLVQESDVIVYAIGIDAGRRSSSPSTVSPGWPPTQPPRVPRPSPPRIPGRGVGLPGQGGGTGGRPPYAGPAPTPPPPPYAPADAKPEATVDVEALRGMTDDTGGRTEIIRSVDELEPVTAGIADELSRQYYLAYQPAAPRDGRWHSIELTVKGRSCQVRTRRGYVASPPSRQ